MWLFLIWVRCVCSGSSIDNLVRIGLVTSLVTRPILKIQFRPERATDSLSLLTSRHSDVRWGSRQDFTSQLPRHLFPRQSCSRLLKMADCSAETPTGPRLCAYSWLTETNKYSAPGVMAWWRPVTSLLHNFMSNLFMAASLNRVQQGCVPPLVWHKLATAGQQKCSDAPLREPDVDFSPGASSHGCVSTNCYHLNLL